MLLSVNFSDLLAGGSLFSAALRGLAGLLPAAGWGVLGAVTALGLLVWAVWSILHMDVKEGMA